MKEIFAVGEQFIWKLLKDSVYWAPWQNSPCEELECWAGGHWLPLFLLTLGGRAWLSREALLGQLMRNQHASWLLCLHCHQPLGNRLVYTDCPYWNLLLSSNGGSDGKESSCNAGDLGWTPGWEDPLRKGMATHSSILAWRIPWTEEPGGLQSMRLQRVRQE